ncbi:MAG: hypothetical protein ACRDNI_00945 [Gaiellaceae bacterium]
MTVRIALEDGFYGDTVAISIEGGGSYSAEDVTTRTQISLAASTELEAPDGAEALDVEIPTRGIRERIELAGRENVALSIRDGQLEARFPERLGFA